MKEDRVHPYILNPLTIAINSLNKHILILDLKSVNNFNRIVKIHCDDWKIMLKVKGNKRFLFIFDISQKQSSRGVLKKRCSENMQQIYRRTSMPKCDFNKQLYFNTSGWLLLI